MPNTYVRKPGSRKYRDFRGDDLEGALAAVADGRLSIREASEQYNVPKSTIHRKFRGQNARNPGGQTAFSRRDEEHIINGLIISAKWRLPFTPLDVRKLVSRFLDRKELKVKQFKNNLPGRVWLNNFLKRHSDKLTLRLSENVKRARAQVNAETINKYFDNIEETLKDVKPDNIVNYDETNVSDDPGQEKVIVVRGTKHTERVIDATKSSHSVMFAITGSGVLLPVYIVYKAKHVYDNWTENGPKDAVYNCSKSGWFDSVLFENWFNKVAFEYLRKLEGPKVIIGDNLASHISITVIEKCENNNIRFVLLPPNSTHVTQPLDVSFFRPFKRSWKTTLLDWKKKHRGTLPKQQFPEELNKALQAISNLKENAISGFKACGLIPINRNEVLKRLPKVDIDLDRTGEDWHAVFEETIKNNQDARIQPLRQVRKKKNSAPPGAPVTKDRLVEGVPEKEKPNPGEPEDENYHVTAEDDNHEDHDARNAEVQSNDLDQIEKEIQDASNTRHNGQEKTLEVGDFILCDFLYNKGTKKEINKQFVCQISSIIPGQGFEVKCMRLNSQLNCYVFPDVEDVATISGSQVNKKLPKPLNKRGKFTFELLS